MVDYRGGYGGLLRWMWWTTQMNMVDYILVAGHGGLQVDIMDYSDGNSGLH